MRGGFAKGPQTAQSPPDGNAQGDKRHRGRSQLTEAQGGPDHKGKNRVFQRIAGTVRGVSQAEHKGAHQPQTRQQEDSLGDPQWLTQDMVARGPGQQGGGDDEGANGIAEPPILPQVCIAGPGLYRSQAQAGDAERRADGRGKASGKEDQAQYVAQALWWNAKAGQPAQQPGPEESLQGVADRNATGDQGRFVDGRIGQERSQGNPWPPTVSEEEKD